MVEFSQFPIFSDIFSFLVYALIGKTHPLAVYWEIHRSSIFMTLDVWSVYFRSQLISGQSIEF